MISGKTLKERANKSVLGGKKDEAKRRRVEGGKIMAGGKRGNKGENEEKSRSKKKGKKIRK